MVTSISWYGSDFLFHCYYFQLNEVELSSYKQTLSTFHFSTTTNKWMNSIWPAANYYFKSWVMLRELGSTTMTPRLELKIECQQYRAWQKLDTIENINPYRSQDDSDLGTRRRENHLSSIMHVMHKSILLPYWKMQKLPKYPKGQILSLRLCVMNQDNGPMQ